jgi:hypothetical protein
MDATGRWSQTVPCFFITHRGLYVPRDILYNRIISRFCKLPPLHFMIKRHNFSWIKMAATDHHTFSFYTANILYFTMLNCNLTVCVLLYYYYSLNIRFTISHTKANTFVCLKYYPLSTYHWLYKHRWILIILKHWSLLTSCILPSYQLSHHCTNLYYNFVFCLFHFTPFPKYLKKIDICVEQVFFFKINFKFPKSDNKSNHRNEIVLLSGSQ